VGNFISHRNNFGSFRINRSRCSTKVSSEDFPVPEHKAHGTFLNPEELSDEYRIPNRRCPWQAGHFSRKKIICASSCVYTAYYISIIDWKCQVVIWQLGRYYI